MANLLRNFSNQKPICWKKLQNRIGLELLFFSFCEPFTAVKSYYHATLIDKHLMISRSYP